MCIFLKIISVASLTCQY